MRVRPRRRPHYLEPGDANGHRPLAVLWLHAGAKPHGANRRGPVNPDRLCNLRRASLLQLLLVSTLPFRADGVALAIVDVQETATAAATLIGLNTQVSND